jgi:REP element-mobilizing transposase RayT
VNALEPEFTETEQEQREQSEPQTDSQVVPLASAPEIKQAGEQAASNSGTGEALGEHDSAEKYLAEISYSCLLIPRFHDHHLTGDITEYLVEWMKQICISYGWRLDAIAVRPGYLQWVMTVPLTENPARVMRLTRQHTSQKIFDDFPRYNRKNMSRDFWAPGYYIAPGNQLLSLESINNFTLVTRKQQGIF